MIVPDAAIAKSLDKILEENFWRDDRTGRWRLPTKEERRKMSAKEEVSAQAHLRVIRRYLEGDLDRCTVVAKGDDVLGTLEPLRR